MAHANTKTVEILALKSAPIPCILDEDPAQLEALAALVEELGYESILTCATAARSQQCRDFCFGWPVSGAASLPFAGSLGPFVRRFRFDRQLAVCVNSPVKNARPGALSRRGTSFPSWRRTPLLASPKRHKTRALLLSTLARSMLTRTAFDRQLRNCTPIHVGCGLVHRVGSLT